MKRILIIAGEVSGDLHGGNLVRAMQKECSSLYFFGIGGESMRSAGVELIYHVDSLAFMGFIEIIRHIPFLKKVKKEILQIVDQKNPDAVILIDYPGFNLSIAKELYKRDKKIFYYISPQLWAWGKNRIEAIKKLIHKMIVVFPFEEKMYREAGVDVAFVGHPLLDVIENYQFDQKEEFYKANGLDPNKKLLTIFPGSRKQEIQKILPEIYNAIKKIKNEFELNIAISAVKSIDKKMYIDIVGENIPLILNKNYELMKYGDFGIIKSGTSTLEAALFKLPFIVVYKTSYLSYLIGKHLIQIDQISIPNIIADEMIVPELIQGDCNAERIYQEIKKLITDEVLRFEMRNKLNKIKSLLGTSGASVKAANLILSEV